MSETDIGQLASLARTALDDPAGVGLDIADMQACLTYATDRLDDIIRITDPIDTGDEEEFSAIAHGLDALGRHVERIRERVENLAAERPAVSGIGVILEEASVALKEGLDRMDEGIAGIRGLVELAEAENECEDCAVNGDDCREHGEAFRLARREILADPERVVALLTEGRSE